MPVLIACARPALALQAGIAGYAGQDGMFCTVCHSGGSIPRVAFTGPTTVDAGATSTFAFIVNSASPNRQMAAGLDIAANAGTLMAVEPELQKEQLIADELTHTAPKDNDPSGQAIWTFKWRAPTTPGSYTLFGAGNSVDLDGTPEGDNAAATAISIMVRAIVTPTTAATMAPTASPTPTATPSPLGTALRGDANCDGAVTAADLPALLTQIVNHSSPVCSGADANRDGRVDEADVPATVGALFGS